jgi:hypothetical protein
VYLGSVIGMHDRGLGRLASPDGHLQRVDDEFGAEMIGDRSLRFACARGSAALCVLAIDWTLRAFPLTREPLDGEILELVMNGIAVERVWS